MEYCKVSAKNQFSAPKNCFNFLKIKLNLAHFRNIFVCIGETSVFLIQEHRAALKSLLLMKNLLVFAPIDEWEVKTNCQKGDFTIS